MDYNISNDKKIIKDQVPGLLSMKLIDGQYHVMVVDQNPNDFRACLTKLGAQSIHPIGVTLNSAVNAFLSKNHNVPS